MTKKYQKNEIDTPTDGEGFVVPERVSVAMAEIAGSMREGLLALAVGTGLQVMQALMEADVTAVAGPKGRHDPGRTAVRHGHERGSVTLGGRRVPVSRPRVRAADGSGELPVPSYELFAGTEILVEGFQAKDGANRANGSVITFTDGKKLFVGSSAGDPGAAPGAPK